MTQEITAIEAAWQDRSLLSNPDYKHIIDSVIRELNQGGIRVAEPTAGGEWQVNEWIKKAILLYFVSQPMQTQEVGIFEYHDKIPLKTNFAASGIRVVPPATIRYGAYIAAGAILMPSYVNVGAYVGERTMVDTWATVGKPYLVKNLFSFKTAALLPILALASALATTSPVLAQTPTTSPGQWTWVSGADQSSQTIANYGTQGVPAPTNVPGGRYGSIAAVDSQGRFYVFGGQSSPAIDQNDLWRFDPATSQWTWLSGSMMTNAHGSYGVKGVASASNQPSARSHSGFTITPQGKLYLFGGQAHDAQGNLGQMNDLWMYNPTSNMWTWISGDSTIDASACMAHRAPPARPTCPALAAPPPSFPISTAISTCSAAATAPILPLSTT